MKKRIWVAMAACVTALSLAACGSGSTEQTAAATEAPQTQAPEEQAPEGQAPGEGGPEGQAPGNGGPEGQAPGNGGPEGQAPGAGGPEGQAPGNGGPEGQAPGEGGPAGEGESDVAYIQEKGTLIVGITDFAPMDYLDDGGEWIGFDADLARLVAEDLGCEVEFVEIDWDNKILELNNKSIDVVWNGMTLTDEVAKSMNCTNAYCNNAQIVVMPADKIGDYTDVASLEGLTFAVEAGSAGAAAAEDLGLSYTEVQAQSDTLLEVASGSSDASIIDSLMAAAMVGEGTSYENLAYGLELTTEEYVVGCRVGSDLTAYINNAFAEWYADGTLMETAETYGVQAALVEQ